MVSAEAQEWEFVPEKAVRSHGPFALLGGDGARWLSQDETTALLGELTALASAGVSADDRLDIRRAAVLVQYGIDTGTGIQVVPPGG